MVKLEKSGCTVEQRYNSICVVDIDGNVVHKLADTYDVMGIIGNGASYSVLQEAGLEYADLLIAVTKSDEVNLYAA